MQDLQFLLYFSPAWNAVYGQHHLWAISPLRRIMETTWFCNEDRNKRLYGDMVHHREVTSLFLSVEKLPISVKVDKGNTWKVKLAAVTDTKPHTITAMSSSGTIMLSDVLFGDVWICSGQSNMVFIMRHLFNATEEIADAVNYPDIRIFTVGMEFSSVPLSDLRSVMETWSLPNKETVGGDGFFSAVCFLYGKRLYNKLKYPIGLVTSAWGGTPIETWSDTTALKKCNIPTFDNENNENNVLWVPTAPSLLWNAMMFPLTNMTIYGALWYQGMI
ncbi:SIAE [Mytilus edulis]|uniref:SIAE n=1 Tax=Mytilus edulis TaxID=6550 RepID=A0A8S3RW64_MYTED|nr:SIAE [Mytilus edulis]